MWRTDSPASSPSSRAANCPPCKLGSSATTEHLERIETGRGEQLDVDAIVGWPDHVTDGSRCYLAVEEQMMVSSICEPSPRVHRAHRTPPLPAHTTASDSQAHRPHRGQRRVRRVVLARGARLDVSALRKLNRSTLNR
ncbi:MAG: NADH-ubiquinone oxidoreductase-F iron-sulfur binding region domain-containing protein [Acidimicrobiia bacterium]